jgi:hypothetical protein
MAVIRALRSFMHEGLIVHQNEEIEMSNDDARSYASGNKVEVLKYDEQSTLMVSAGSPIVDPALSPAPPIGLVNTESPAEGKLEAG